MKRPFKCNARVETSIAVVAHAKRREDIVREHLNPLTAVCGFGDDEVHALMEDKHDFFRPVRRPALAGATRWDSMRRVLESFCRNFTPMKVLFRLLRSPLEVSFCNKCRNPRFDDTTSAWETKLCTCEAAAPVSVKRCIYVAGRLFTLPADTIFQKRVMHALRVLHVFSRSDATMLSEALTKVHTHQLRLQQDPADPSKDSIQDGSYLNGDIVRSAHIIFRHLYGDVKDMRRRFSEARGRLAQAYVTSLDDQLQAFSIAETTRQTTGANLQANTPYKQQIATSAEADSGRITFTRPQVKAANMHGGVRELSLLQAALSPYMLYVKIAHKFPWSTTINSSGKDWFEQRREEAFQHILGWLKQQSWFKLQAAPLSEEDDVDEASDDDEGDFKGGQQVAEDSAAAAPLPADDDDGGGGSTCSTAAPDTVDAFDEMTLRETWNSVFGVLKFAVSRKGGSTKRKVDVWQSVGLDRYQYQTHSALYFWRQAASRLDMDKTHPFLRAVRALLCVPGTSVPEERLFSELGKASKGDRSRISIETLENVAMCSRCPCDALPAINWPEAIECPTQTKKRKRH